MPEEMNKMEGTEQELGGKVSIAEEVIAQIASKALSEVDGAEPASPGLVANIMSGYKASNGIRVAVVDDESDEVTIDAYIGVKYGSRIPDVCWDVQEGIKKAVEDCTGRKVKAVNVTVQNIIFAEKSDGDDAAGEDA
ncbi:MAG: Asp23/Gls24 family envelope stress response protein [Synergistes sp.]|nr:Asp23/Gls24 family envelope stress response protein [Synergistes sp.]